MGNIRPFAAPHQTIISRKIGLTITALKPQTHSLAISDSQPYKSANNVVMATSHTTIYDPENSRIWTIV